MINSIIGEHSGLFACPVCGSGMVLSTHSLRCDNNHSYDLARAGYVNFITRQVGEDYSKELLYARRRAMEAGLFHTLLDEVATLLTPASTLLDAGCGEGSHLAYLSAAVGLTLGVGIDLAKQGISLAAKSFKGQLWCVGDLAATPFGDSRFDDVLSILSPANYTEFKRIIRPGGRLIKVVPGSGYLKEIRRAFYDDTDRASYSNQQVVELFSQRFQLVDRRELSYEFTLSGELLKDIIAMSPLSWQADREKVVRLEQVGLQTITLDFTILVGGAVK